MSGTKQFEVCDECGGITHLRLQDHAKHLTPDVRLREAIDKSIDDEPEYPDAMPDEMWNAVRDDRDAATEAFRTTVRLTKQGIKERFHAALSTTGGKDKP